MATQNTQHPSQETTYSMGSSAGKPEIEKQAPSDDGILNKKPVREDIDEEQDETDDEEIKTQNKEWK